MSRRRSKWTRTWLTVTARRADPREPRELSEPDNDDRFGTEPVELRQHLQKVAAEVQVIKERLERSVTNPPEVDSHGGTAVRRWRTPSVSGGDA